MNLSYFGYLLHKNYKTTVCGLKFNLHTVLYINNDISFE